MISLNDLIEITTLDGTEMIPVQQGGVWYKASLSRLLGVTPVTITAAPTSFVATAIDDTQIDLTWSGSGDFILDRSLDESSWEPIYAGSTASFSDTLLYGDNQYFYRVSATDTGEIQSDWVYTDATTLPV